VATYSRVNSDTSWPILLLIITIMILPTGTSNHFKGPCPCLCAKLPSPRQARSYNTLTRTHGQSGLYTRTRGNLHLLDAL
jgi:hypothetical protein